MPVWSDTKQHHFYTANVSERDALITNDHSWSYEGAAYSAFKQGETGTFPVYRFWSAKKQGHFFTINESEKNSIIATDPTWTYEGVGWYVPNN